jgi:hypothetical protein
VVNPQGITFAAVGDIMLGTDYPDNILPDDDGVSFLGSVTPVLAAGHGAMRSDRAKISSDSKG